MALGTKRKAANTLSKQPLDLPPATVHAFAGTTAPEGWAMCDGSEVSRTEYAALFAAVGTTYGVGDGLDTFNLPDMRGQFLRALDDMGTAQGAAGVDVDGTARTVGQSQSDAMQKMLGEFELPRYAGGASQINTTESPFTIGSAGGSRPSVVDSSFLTSQKIIFDSSQDSKYKTSGDGSGDGETRPKNMAVNYIIKL